MPFIDLKIKREGEIDSYLSYFFLFCLEGKIANVKTCPRDSANGKFTLPDGCISISGRDFFLSHRIQTDCSGHELTLCILMKKQIFNNIEINHMYARRKQALLYDLIVKYSELV
jgi:hypothetical protein